jgi:hypothetical protein
MHKTSSQIIYISTRGQGILQVIPKNIAQDIRLAGMLRHKPDPRHVEL